MNPVWEKDKLMEWDIRELEWLHFNSDPVQKWSTISFMCEHSIFEVLVRNRVYSREIEIFKSITRPEMTPICDICGH